MNQPQQTPAAGGPPTESERTWGMLAHLSALAGLVIPLIGNVLGPLVIWMAKRDRSAFIATEALEALNFNITVSLGAILCCILMLVFIGFLLGFALFIVWLVSTLVAAIRASDGATYRYPFSLHLVK